MMEGVGVRHRGHSSALHCSGELEDCCGGEGGERRSMSVCAGGRRISWRGRMQALCRFRHDAAFCHAETRLTLRFLPSLMVVPTCLDNYHPSHTRISRVDKPTASQPLQPFLPFSTSRSVSTLTFAPCLRLWRISRHHREQSTVLVRSHPFGLVFVLSRPIIRPVLHSQSSFLFYLVLPHPLHVDVVLERPQPCRLPSQPPPGQHGVLVPGADEAQKSLLRLETLHRAAL